MQNVFAAAALAACMFLSQGALAHGVPAKHGGVVASAGDLAFELVARDGKAVIHVSDHGRDVATDAASGKLTVLQRGKKTETALVPAGSNALASKEPVALSAGAKAVASINLPGKEPISVRFALKSAPK